MMSRIIIFIFLAQILYLGIGKAQGFNRFGDSRITSVPQSVTTIAPVNNEYSEWSLPPLQMLIHTALENSPLIQMANTNVQMGEYEFKDVRRNWLNNISIIADARYGSMFNYTKFNTTASSMLPQDMLIDMFNYGAGLNLYMPFSEIFDKKRSKQKASLKIEQAELQKEEIAGSITQLVINAYYEVLSAQKTLSMYNEISLSASLLHEQAKLDFNTNRISLSDFTQTTETYLNAQNRVELQKYSLMRAIRILEVIVGIELIK